MSETLEQIKRSLREYSINGPGMLGADTAGHIHREIRILEAELIRLRASRKELLEACQTMLSEPDYEPDGDGDGYWRGCHNTEKRIAKMFLVILTNATGATDGPTNEANL